jgi:hypothetical protein
VAVASQFGTGNWRRRFYRISLLSLILGSGVVLGAAVTAAVAVRLLMPLAGVGLAVLLTSSGPAIINALASGDSETRMEVLLGLEETLNTPGQARLDAQTASWLLMALELCATDPDPEVVLLAEEVAWLVRAHADDA